MVSLLGATMRTCIKIYLVLMNYVGYVPVYVIRRFRKSEKCPAITDKLLLLPAGKLAELIRTKQVTCEAVIRAYIARVQAVNPLINAVIEDRFTEALTDARNADRFIENSGLTVEEVADKYPLLGVPITIKGSIALAGMLHTGGVVKRAIRADVDATPVKYARDAGAIPILTSNVPELCLNWETTNKLIGTTRNPYNTARSVGGSSGGEAALMGAGASLVGIGSDIAGSLRLPPHFCGVWGHKPTPGAVSYEGHYPSCKVDEDWRQLFTLGPLTRYAADLRLLLQIICEPDMRPLLNLQNSVNVKDIKVYYMYEVKSNFADAVNVNVSSAMDNVIEHLNKICDFNCSEVDLPLMKYSAELSYLRLAIVDEVDNLFEGRGDGVYGELLKLVFCCSQSTFTSIMYGLIRRYIDYMPKRNIGKVHDKLEQLRNDFLKLLGTEGVFVCPIYPQEAFCHGDVYRQIFNFGYLSIFNALGFPATSCPVDTTSEGLPVGVQVVAAPNCDRLALAVAEELEREFGGWKPSLLET